MVNAAAQLLIKSKLSCSLVGVTVDCVHGRSRTEVVQELDGKCYMVGAGTRATDLSNAALGAGEINGRASLPEDEIATSLMTVVLQDWDGKHKVLVGVIPVTSETGELIKNVIERLREILFAHHLYLVFGGGDGAAPNLEAWRLMKLVSNGNKHTILRNALRAADMPFFLVAVI